MAKFDEISTDAAGGQATSSGSTASLSSSLSSSLASSTSASRERLNDDGHTFDDEGMTKGTLSMDMEVEAAATFLTDIIKASRFNDQTMESFRQALTTLLKQHYDGHWYPNDPFKGSGYRCLRVNGVMNPLLTKAAQLSGLPLTKFRHAFPVEFTVWVDPGDVSVRYGEDGSIGCVYPSSGKGLKHDHQQMEDLKKLVQLQKQQQQQQLQHLLQLQLQQQQATSHFSSPSSQHHHRVCSTPPPAPVCEKVHVSMNHRGSPNTTTFLPGSPPSSSFMFSPYDGKCLKLPSLAAGSHHPQNSSFLTSSRTSDQSPPSRKYQAIMQQSMLDRRTPPAYAAAVASSPSTNMFGGGGGFYAGSAASDLISTKNSFSVANQNNRMMLDCDSILMPSSALARHTPPFRTMTPTNHQSSPMYHQQQADSDWMLNAFQYHQSSPQQQQNANDYQFYTNTHFGSSFTSNTTTTPSSRLVEPLGAAN